MLFNLEDELDLDLNTDSLADSLESVVEQSSGVDALAQHSPTEVGSSALAQTSQKSPLNKAQSQESKTFHAEVDNVKTFCTGSDEIETRSNEIEIENHSNVFLPISKKPTMLSLTDIFQRLISRKPQHICTTWIPSTGYILKSFTVFT